MNNTSHDDHYKRKHEPIEVIEEVSLLRGLRGLLDPSTILNIAFATKYALRIGLKGDIRTAHQDIDKAINYLTRAKTGLWPWETEK